MTSEEFVGSLRRHFDEHGPEAGFPKELLPAYLRSDAVIVEAGAHVGADTIELARLFPEGRIVAYEPAPNLFDQLSVAVKDQANISAFQLALAERNGTLKFYLSSGTSDAASSLLPPKDILWFHPTNSFEENIDVEAVVLTDHLRSLGIDGVDMLWLDLQGYEFHVLKTLGDQLSGTKLIFMEVSLIEVYEGVPLYDEARPFLRDAGFSVVYEQLPWKDAGNIVAVRSDGFKV